MTRYGMEGISFYVTQNIVDKLWSNMGIIHSLPPSHITAAPVCFTIFSPSTL